MPLKPGHYLIVNGGKSVGRPLIEDRSNNPKRIILLPRGFREQEIKWVIEGDDHKGYIASIRGDPTAPIDSKVFALLHGQEKAEKWHIEPVPQHGPNRYIILTNDRKEGWVAPDDGGAQINCRPLIVGLSHPPRYSPHAIFELIPRSLRPSADTFRNAGWLPKSQEAYHKYMKKLFDKSRNKLGKADDEVLLPPVRVFKNFIETEPNVYGEFVRMFENVDTTEPDTPKDYQELIVTLNEIFREAPAFGDLGPPVYMVMAEVMNTQGGFSAFTKDNLNRHFKMMFETWTRFLTSKDSRDTLNSGSDGWFSTEALKAMLEQFPNRTFEQVFICDPKEDYYGYTSYEDFFNRRFRDPAYDRPTGPLANIIVGAPCECTTYAYQEDVKEMDELFIKDEAYSLRHLLAENYVQEFVGGKVIQGFLNTTGYHRWHSPVNGTIMKIVDVAGTYFAQAPSSIGESLDTPPYLRSLRYFSNTAARQLMFIQPDATDIGLMCFISIGMTEISSCQATVYERQHVMRGDELGMFHFGGSSCALVFQKGSLLEIDDQFKVPEVAMKINGPIGAVPV